MLKRLKLHRFRYTQPGTELMFTERFNVLLGRNGTGKTTLLDLISMVLRSDFSALKDEAFDIEYEWSDRRDTGVVRFQNKLTLPLPGPPASTTLRGAAKARQYQPHVLVRIQPDRPAKELESVEQIQKTFIQCRTEPVDGEPQTSWSNLSAEDAAELFAD